MKLEMRGQLRLEQKMKLAPHMIQSMEILQLPILALQERIEQELNSNPVLDIEEPQASETTETTAETAPSSETVSEPEDFGRIERLDDDYTDYMDRAASFRRDGSADEPDKKLEALKNTEAGPQSLHEHLHEQWRLIETEPAVKKAGTEIIDYINNRGYLAIRLEQLYNKDKSQFTVEDLKQALKLVQNLEPAGVGARDLKECLLIQMRQSSDDMSFEQRLIAGHIDELLDNRLPDIAKKMRCTIEQINQAIERIAKFDTSPGLQITKERNCPITADVIVERSEEDDTFIVRLADYDLPALRVSSYYIKMTEDSKLNEKTKQFLQNNIRSANWIIEAIEQRKNTLLRVARSIVNHQKDFFEKGRLHLRPLPMSKVADEIGVHLATVSRAVAGKHIRCSWGILPLRKFFSGGTEDESGHELSWEAIRAKLQQVIDSEDKRRPLSDDQIRKKLSQTGIKNIARRTVAKYRKLLNVPAARFRKKY